MASPKREVWSDVEIQLELAIEFDPEAFERTHPGLAPLLAELLIGPPRIQRDTAELWPYAGLKTLEARLPRLRFIPAETKRLALGLDRLFTALEFNIVGHKVLAIPNPEVQHPDGWRSSSGVWLCHQPLAS